VAKRLWEKTAGHLFGRGGEREIYNIENENITLDDRIKKPLNLLNVYTWALKRERETII
jgi:hypothetical protein